MNAQGVLNRLKNLGHSQSPITPRTFRTEGTTQSNTNGERSRIARLRADTPLKLQQGRENPMRVAIPAYAQKTTNGTAGEAETFDLPHNLIDSPVTTPVDLWEGGDHVQPDSVDVGNNQFTYTDDGTNNALHVWFMTDAAATLDVEKVTPGSSTSSSQDLYDAALRLVHQTDQTDEPEFLELQETPLQPWIAQDMALDVYIDAPFNVRLTDPNGSGAYPTNARLHLPAFKGKGVVKGLPSVVKADMG